MYLILFLTKNSFSRFMFWIIVGINHTIINMTNEGIIRLHRKKGIICESTSPCVSVCARVLWECVCVVGLDGGRRMHNIMPTSRARGRGRDRIRNKIIQLYQRV